MIYRAMVKDMDRNTFRDFTSQKNYLIYMKERITDAVLELDDMEHLKEDGLCSSRAIEGMHQYIDLLKQHMKEEVEKVKFVVDSIEAIEDDMCKQVMTMRYIEGLSMKQVKEQTGLPQAVLYSMQGQFSNDLGI